MGYFPLPQKHSFWFIVPKQLLKRMWAEKLFTLGYTQLSLLTFIFCEEYPALAFLDWSVCSSPSKAMSKGERIYM